MRRGCWRVWPPTTARRARWAQLQQDLTDRSRHGRAVNLDPAALILDMIFKIEETAQAISPQPEGPDMTQATIIDSHCHLDFPGFRRRARRSDRARAGRRRCADGDDLHQAAAGTTGPRHRRGLCARVLRRRHPPDERGGRAAGHRGRTGRPGRHIRNSSASAKPGWITTTPPKARTFSNSPCASISQRRAKPACR